MLVRHGNVAECYQGVCYGRSDIELSHDGQQQSIALTEELAALPITHLYHSGLKRAAVLAEMIALRTSLVASLAPALAEINFGEWELRPWQSVFEEVGDAMAQILHAPESFRPPAGETVFELRDRVLDWHRRLPREGCMVAIAHGGPIAALRGALAGIPVSQWPGLVPATGQWIELDETTALQGLES
ncbi:MAG TPA: histidine phosphatase family protein [Pirellulales bacterium]|nr:histidine phosphatase family protein [Pirellulales bacterium]